MFHEIKGKATDKPYENSRFVIQGYNDNSGKPASYCRISTDNAEAGHQCLTQGYHVSIYPVNFRAISSYFGVLANGNRTPIPA